MGVPSNELNNQSSRNNGKKVSKGDNKRSHQSEVQQPDQAAAPVVFHHATPANDYSYTPVQDGRASGSSKQVINKFK